MYWILISGIVLLVDYLTGPLIEFPIVFVIPIALASWYSGLEWGLTFALLLPIGRIIIRFLWEPSTDFSVVLINAVIRVSVLTGIVFMVNQVAALTREVKALRGILPTCSVCKKNRTPECQWKEIEIYISEHSEARFSHGICDTCKERLYPELFANRNKTFDCSTKA